MTGKPTVLDYGTRGGWKRPRLLWDAKAVTRRSLLFAGSALGCVFAEYLMHGVRVYQGWRYVYWVEVAVASAAMVTGLLLQIVPSASRRDRALAALAILAGMLTAAWAVTATKIIVN